ncbi:hypothetical protein FT663_04095 [Candidozyma haemuli var. vulneris]|uniref:Uncharacterized protein n=1 Tax=Candidozyma haemuli TaxID=45357 RepID=A0A2V1AUD4_9ASCO|nr:hypothetical protein CXQ85_004415 [[Candida] haemuloni]KAF3988004.1 hypothetical protein FT662_03657 [[Candida] haemuloni var. vulneris]KAF3988271.1 hypothetical protein FT663_04095 [[Candida] haemuloni var. vulneris]PVH20903.1 hypothetical protein CXQ85_004415 [[Candida] haemuloni]
MFLPDNFRLRFVKSSFDGLLPGDFVEGIPIREVTSSIPRNMNSKNKFAVDKIVDLKSCDVFIDNSSKSDISVGDPPIWIEDDVLDPQFERVHCTKMINGAGQHRGVGRLLYIPKSLRRFVDYEIDYMDFCLLRITS